MWLIVNLLVRKKTTIFCAGLQNAVLDERSVGLHLADVQARRVHLFVAREQCDDGAYCTLRCHPVLSARTLEELVRGGQAWAEVSETLTSTLLQYSSSTTRGHSCSLCQTVIAPFRVAALPSLRFMSLSPKQYDLNKFYLITG